MNSFCGNISRDQKDRLTAASALRLNWRTLDRTKRAKHAAVTRVGTQQSLAFTALIEELAGICGHGFLLGKTAVRTGQHGLEDSGAHPVINSRLRFHCKTDALADHGPVR
jgi:hypothetical protein